MEKEYAVTFVFTNTIVFRTVITGIDDKEMIAQMAIDEIMEETGMDVSHASWQVEEA